MGPRRNYRERISVAANLCPLASCPREVPQASGMRRDCSSWTQRFPRFRLVSSAVASRMPESSTAGTLPTMWQNSIPIVTDATPPSLSNSAGSFSKGPYSSVRWHPDTYRRSGFRKRRQCPRGMTLDRMRCHSFPGDCCATPPIWLPLPSPYLSPLSPTIAPSWLVSPHPTRLATTLANPSAGRGKQGAEGKGADRLG